jgi:dipeptidyl aminopeptidase/acylaminoacyl peptidase
MHGKADQTVPPQQSIILAEALRKAAVPVDLVLVDGMGHGARGFTTLANLKRVIEFFDKHLKGPAAQAAQP